MAICLAVLMGFAGMAIDIGFLEYHQQVQQAATDAAALGAAQAAYKASCANNAAAIAAGQTDATLNGFTQGGNVTVSVVPDPSTGVYAGKPCAVDVTISNKVQTFFSQVLGFFGMTETTHAIGLAPSGGSTGCVWLLLPGNSQTSNFSNATFSAPGCSIYINSAGSANMSNATINAGYIGYNGQAPNEGGATFSSATPKPMSPSASDPCSTIAGCKWLTNNASSIESASCGSGSYGSNSSVGDSSGTGTKCFSTLALQGSNITVCGLIEIVGGQLQMSGGAVVNSCPAGVTFFMGSQTNTVNVSGGSHLTLSAPTSGNTAGVLFWRDPSQNNSVNFSSAVYSFSGLIYFPTADVTYSAGSSGYTELVFGSANFSAGATLATPGPGASGTSQVTLAQ